MPAHRGAHEISDHPRFADARRVYVDGMLGLHGGDPLLNRMLVEEGRIIVFGAIACLAAGEDAADRASWPTMSLLQHTVARLGVASARRVDDIVARLIHTGFIEVRTPPSDRRVRMLEPTEKMLALDRKWLMASYSPLANLYPDDDIYATLIRGDPAAQTGQRRAALSTIDQQAHAFFSNPSIQLFLERDAGFLVLSQLIHNFYWGEGDEEATPSYAAVAERFGVSRTHVRRMFREAEDAGLVRLGARGGYRVTLLPPLRAAYDEFVSECLAYHDLTLRIALAE